MKLAFSTVWADGDLVKLREVLPYIHSLEIGSLGDSGFFSSLEELVINEKIPVTSIHSIAGPHKQEKDTCYTGNFASFDRNARENDLSSVELTARWARKVGAKSIILHAGMVGDDTWKKPYLTLKEQFLQNGESRELDDMRKDMTETRESAGRKNLKNTVSGLIQLCKNFPDITFCFETRLYFHQIPLPDEALYIFDSIRLPNLAYWHDIGHTYIMDRLGFVRMEKWQDMFFKKCAGIHLHDVDQNLLDHYPPGYGVLDIPSILKGFGNNILPTLEINSKHTNDMVIKGLEYMRRL